MLVIRREYGILKRLRSTPLPGALYLAAVLLSTLIVFALQSIVVVALGRRPLRRAAARRTGSLVRCSPSRSAPPSFAGLGLAIAALVRSAEGSRRS